MNPADLDAKVACYIGIGSNLENPLQQSRLAIKAIDKMAHARLQTVSSFYRSEPLGPSDQPQYVNSVARLLTPLAPLDLLDELQRIENRQGRVRGVQRWGARTIDLDILLYGTQIIQSDRLTVPHPGITRREFVLRPLLEIAPLLAIPGKGLACSHLQQVPDLGVTIIKEA